jgi:D-alanyl-D-alanine carboxypeptidase
VAFDNHHGESSKQKPEGDELKKTEAAPARLVGALVFALATVAVVTLPVAAGATTKTSPAPATKLVTSPLAKGTQAKLAKALDSAWHQTVSPGAIVGVWVGDKGWVATRGTTRKGAHEMPTLQEHTRIGSITKTFTGTVILQLVDEGKLKLSDKLSRWFPWMPEAANITIRELGDMSSGINSYSLDESFTNSYLAEPQETWTPIQLIKIASEEPRKFPVGQGFFYSNTNFLLLGQIAAKVTGRPIGRLIRERIFEPLGMAQSSYPFTTALPTPFWNGYTNQNVTGTKVRNATHWSTTAEGAAGQIVSTLGDLRTYVKALGSGSLISNAAQKARLQPNPFSVAAGREYDFAIGKDHGWLSHSGEVPGFNTIFGYLPKLKAEIVVLTNTDIEAQPKIAPAPAIMSALTEVVSPANVSTP